jgi:hypothetical protein
MEMGKDVLAIAPDGIPCAFQLKAVPEGGKLSLADYRRELGQQIHPLTSERIVHPSIPQDKYHRSIIVINGELDEEVSRAIDDFNKTNDQRGYPERKVEVFLKGHLFRAFQDLQADFWATNLNDLRTYLELLTEAGDGQLPKEKLCALLQSALPFEAASRKGKTKQPGDEECTRAIAGCAIICASAISQYTLRRNHLAEFEAWTLYLGYTLALVERWGLRLSKYKFALDVAQDAIYSSLGRLCDELMERQTYVEGTALPLLADTRMYQVRITHLLGLMGLYGLWRDRRIKDGVEKSDQARDDFLRRLFTEKNSLLLLWGEYAIPQILAYNFYARRFLTPRETETRLLSLLAGITKANAPGGKRPLPNPYSFSTVTF